MQCSNKTFDVLKICLIKLDQNILVDAFRAINNCLPLVFWVCFLWTEDFCAQSATLKSSKYLCSVFVHILMHTYCMSYTVCVHASGCVSSHVIAAVASECLM